MRHKTESLPWHERLQWRLVIAFLVVFTISSAPPATYFWVKIERLIENVVVSELEKHLEFSLYLSERDLENNLDPSRLFNTLGKRSGLRITWINPDGQVRIDNRLDREVGSLGNHLDRPEVRAALAGERKYFRRLSDTTSNEFIYMAVATSLRGEGGHVLRVGLPYKEIRSRIVGARVTLALSVLVAFVLGALLAALLARQFAEPLRALTSVASSVAEGRFDEEMPPSPRGEAALLYEALERLKVQISEKVEQLEDEKQLLLTIVGAMTEGLVVVDASGRIIVTNPRALELCGVEHAWTASEASGRLLIEVTRLTRLNEILELTFSTSLEQRDEIQTTRRPTRFLGVSSAPLREGGEVRGAVLAFFDLTTIRQLERVRQDFVSNVSHELRTPVAAIAGWAETLTSGAVELPSFANEKILVMLAHARRLAALVDDLLILTRLESIGLEGSTVDVDLQELISEVVESLQEVVLDHSVQLNVELNTDTPFWQGDERGLTYIIRNLLENAMKYGRHGVEVSLKVEYEQGGTLSVSVQDDGQGIEEQHMSRIFERFYRVDQGRSRRLGGTGLGLAIVKHFVNAAGGCVRVDSEVGRGSLFRVWIPDKGATFIGEAEEEPPTTDLQNESPLGP